MAFVRRLMRLVASSLLMMFAAVGMAVCGVAVYLAWLPDVRYLALQNPKSSAYIEQYVQQQVRRHKKPLVMMQWTPLGQISPHLRHAVVISEDDMFYRHNGIDWEAMSQAIDYDMKKGKLARGASTITQQVARNLFLSPSKNPLRKAKEILIAWKLERALTKDRILEIYLNIAEWGMGVYGAEAASRIYFGKDASMLTVDESLALAAALPSPWRLSPPKQGPRMAKRKEVLLSRMRKAGYLPEDVPEADIDVPEEIDAMDTPAVSTAAAAGTPAPASPAPGGPKTSAAPSPAPDAKTPSAPKP